MDRLGRNALHMTDLYDPACELLAQHFLQDETPETQEAYERRLQSLAAEIQQAVDAWFAAHPAPVPTDQERLF